MNLERAVSESQAAGYVWLELSSLKDMLAWVEGEQDRKAAVLQRIEAASAKFCVGA